jgi:hypothetical protein
MSVVIHSELENLYSTNPYAISIYQEIFNTFPSRLVVSDVTKGFFKKVQNILNLEVLSEDYGYNPKNLKDIRKVIYVDSANEILVIELAKLEERTYVFHYSNSTIKLLIDDCLKLSKKYKVRYPKEEYTPTIELVISTHSGLDTIVRDFNFTALTRDELSIFYGKNFLDIYDRLLEFLDIHRKLVLLHGQPGTGKSTLIKQLITEKDDNLLYFSPENISLLGTPQFTKFLLEHTDKVIVAEDCETILVNSDIRSSATSNLLNLTDGILAEIYNCGLLATFNTNISNLDPALVRPGRLFLDYELKALTIEESNIFLEYKNSTKRVDREMTLAELFSIL